MLGLARMRWAPLAVGLLTEAPFLGQARRLYTSMSANVPPLLTASEALRMRSQLVMLDGSWHLPTANRDPLAEYEAKHVADAGFFDVHHVADQDTDLPHMLPSPERFAACVTELGITSPDQAVCVYVTEGAFSAARIWWIFRAFQHRNVCILQGGLPAWEAAGGPVESGKAPSAASSGTYPTPSNPKFLVEASELLGISKETAEGRGDAQIVDTRPAARFNGEAPEPRASLKRGNVPGSVNLSFSKLMKEGDVTMFKDVAEAEEAFKEANIDVSNPQTYTTCGTGVTAAVASFQLFRIQCEKNKAAAEQLGSFLYDGSWAEWGARDDLPGKF